MWKWDILKRGSIRTQQWTDVHVGKIAQHLAGGNENISLNLALQRCCGNVCIKSFSLSTDDGAEKADGKWSWTFLLFPLLRGGNPTQSVYLPALKKTNWLITPEIHLKGGENVRPPPLPVSSFTLHFLCHTRVENIIPNMRKGRTCNRLMTSHFPHHFT